jgi:hypothetical protein
MVYATTMAIALMACRLNKIVCTRLVVELWWVYAFTTYLPTNHLNASIDLVATHPFVLPTKLQDLNGLVLQGSPRWNQHLPWYLTLVPSTSWVRSLNGDIKPKICSIWTQKLWFSLSMGYLYYLEAI